MGFRRRSTALWSVLLSVLILTFYGLSLMLFYRGQMVFNPPAIVAWEGLNNILYRRQRRRLLHQSFHPTASLQYRPFELRATHGLLRRLLNNQDDVVGELRQCVPVLSWTDIIHLI